MSEEQAAPAPAPPSTAAPPPASTSTTTTTDVPETNAQDVTMDAEMDGTGDAEGEDMDADADGDALFEEDLGDIPFGLGVANPSGEQHPLQQNGNGHGHPNIPTPHHQPPRTSSLDLGRSSAYPPSTLPYTPIAIETSSGTAMPSVLAPMASSYPSSGASTIPLTAGTSTAPLPPLQSLSSTNPALPPKRPRGRPRKIPGTESRGPAAPRVRVRTSKPRGGGGSGSTKRGKRGRKGDSSEEEDDDGGESDSGAEDLKQSTNQGPLNMQEELPDDYDPTNDKARTGPTTKFGRKITKPAQFIPGNKPVVPRKKKPAANPDAHLMCGVCKSGHSQPSNLLVICDSCSKGWHQICHLPPINEEVATSDLPWLCFDCDIKIANSRPRPDVSKGEWTSGQGLMGGVNGAEGGSGGGIGSYTIREKTEWLEGLPLHALIGYILSIEQKYASRLPPPGLQIWPQHLPKVLEQARATRAADNERRLREEEAGGSIADSDTNSSYEPVASPALARTIASRRIANMPSPASSSASGFGLSQSHGPSHSSHQHQTQGPPPQQLQHRPQSQNQIHPIPTHHSQSPNPSQQHRGSFSSSQGGMSSSQRPASQQSHRSSFGDPRGPPHGAYSTSGGYAPPPPLQSQQQFPPMRQRSPPSPKSLPPSMPPFMRQQYAPVPALQSIQTGHRSGPSSPNIGNQYAGGPLPSPQLSQLHSPQLHHSPQMSGGGSPQLNSPNQSQFSMQQQQHQHHQLPPPQNRGPPSLARPTHSYSHSHSSSYAPPPPPPPQQQYSPNPNEGPSGGHDYRRHSGHSSHSSGYVDSMFDAPAQSPSMGTTFYSPLTTSGGSASAGSNGGGGAPPPLPPPGQGSGQKYSPNPNQPYYYGSGPEQGQQLDHWAQQARTGGNGPPSQH